ncbi:hypothetical protein [Sphingobacterium haloxyli]|uniref:Uncharacterized protein n=1 Tax=Sphingobacterium haloxyli TaxID=2100533 RepID=A0A2S9IVI4_9SPHI|nr:hypothetical protein [Sphingobacterium haloxyli]PRD44532.1 hypothetical protein C5745_19330 [Sphingobacterium haloxyli]
MNYKLINMKTSLQRQTKCENPKAAYKATMAQPGVTSEKKENRFRGMSENLEKAEPLYIPGYKIRG